MRSLGRFEGPFNLMVGVELLCNISVQVSVEFVSAAVKIVPLSETSLLGFPLSAKNRLKVLMKVSADWSWHISKCTNRVVRQTITTP